MFNEIYWAQRPNNGAFYFENYQGQDAILIDDFYGYYPRDFLLRLCQPYECRLPYRGGEAECLARNIIFTTNKKPWQWYKEKNIENLTRRVTHWIYFTGYKTYSQFKDFQNFYEAVELREPDFVQRVE